MREMQAQLKFNICGLKTSYESNSDILDLDSRMSNCVPSHLSYACCFWADNLVAIEHTQEWCSRIDVLIKTRLLFWLEVLSLLNKVGQARVNLLKLRGWLSPVVHDPNPYVRLLMFTYDIYPERSSGAETICVKFILICRHNFPCTQREHSTPLYFRPYIHTQGVASFKIVPISGSGISPLLE